MKPFAVLSLCLAAALAAPVPALADAACPPGLAKKSPACIPPGQAKRSNYGKEYWRDNGDDIRPGERYMRGDRVSDNYIHWITHPERYGLAPAGRNWRYGIIDGRIVRIDRDTLKVLDLVRAVDAILD